MDERNLTGDVAFRQPPHLSFPNHVHGFYPDKRSRRRVKRPETLHRSHPALYGAVVLFEMLFKYRTGRHRQRPPSSPDCFNSDMAFR